MEENKTINIKKALEESNQEPQQPSQEELVQLLSQTIIRQDAEIKTLKEELQDARKHIAYLQDELSKPQSDVMEAEESIRHRHISTYLNYELDYAECKVKELRHHLADYPEDGYSHTDLQNCLLHINYLKAMIRRLNLRG